MGTTAAETFESGTWAAATGGTTMLVDFVLPGEDGSLLSAVDSWDAKSKDQICVDIGYHCAIVDWNEQIHNEMAEVVRRGINTFKHFMAYKGALMIDDDEMFASLPAGAPRSAPCRWSMPKTATWWQRSKKNTWKRASPGRRGTPIRGRRRWRARPPTVQS